MVARGGERARATVRRLQDDVRRGRWPVDGQIPTEAELAAEFGVGRSTIREAVSRLAHLGMLEPAPGRGTFVRSLVPLRGILSDFAAEHSWADIFAVRRGLEAQAAYLAAANIDEDGAARLRLAHEADTPGAEGALSGKVPGRFHAIIVELSRNELLAELHTGMMSALQRGVATGQIAPSQGAEQRRADHAAVLAAIAAGRPEAAASLAAAHAEDDFRVTGPGSAGS
ncbi:FadR/GntR family transcriptional regulator [Nocardioides insulae]|uniref:FadR/GntR family transcriptional regulator n=1 Tax=Nocardioides insulae TaxID=394734 RepID=UPI00042382FD|nr:FCD domain-containing protein [Nocardioides insulae]